MTDANAFANELVTDALLSCRTGILGSAIGWCLLGNLQATTSVWISRHATWALAGIASGLVVANGTLRARVGGALVNVRAAVHSTGIGAGVARVAEALGLAIDKIALSVGSTRSLFTWIYKYKNKSITFSNKVKNSSKKFKKGAIKTESLNLLIIKEQEFQLTSAVVSNVGLRAQASVKMVANSVSRAVVINFASDNTNTPDFGIRVWNRSFRTFTDETAWLVDTHCIFSASSTSSTLVNI